MALELHWQAGTVPLEGGRFALFCNGGEKYVHSILTITCPDIPSENISIDGNGAYVTFPALM